MCHLMLNWRDLPLGSFYLLGPASILGGYKESVQFLLGWPAHPGLPTTFPILAPKVLCPRKPLSLANWDGWDSVLLPSLFFLRLNMNAFLSAFNSSYLSRETSTLCGPVVPNPSMQLRMALDLKNVSSERNCDSCQINWSLRGFCFLNLKLSLRDAALKINNDQLSPSKIISCVIFMTKIFSAKGDTYLLFCFSIIFQCNHWS